MDTFRPRRSALYLPAVNPRATRKAATLPVDVIIFDLEDSVAPADKDAARAAAAAAVAGGGYGRRELVVRVNGEQTPWHGADLSMCAQTRPHAVAVPKVETAAEVARVRELLGTPDLPVWVMIETPRGVLNAEQISAAEGVGAVVLGTNDLAKELGVPTGPDRAPLLTALSLAVLAAKAAGRLVLDGVFNDLTDLAGFRAQCHEARRLGFDGKTLIHPSQVPIANDVFAPTAAEVAEARELVTAWQSQSAGVATFQGRMIEALHVEAAERLLQQAATMAGNDEVHLQREGE